MHKSITFRSEGRVVYTPPSGRRLDLSTYLVVNPLYPSCPLGMRVSDLPTGWASAGHEGGGHKSRNAGVDNTKAKLTPSDVTTIRRLVDQGTPAVTLADDYGVAKSTISRVVRGVTWRG